jgi:hypothetical protein
MRPLTHGMMVRIGCEVSGTSRWVLTALAAVAAVLSGAGCSSEPVGVAISNGGSGGGAGTPIPVDDPLAQQCGQDGILCGEGCCTAGNLCSRFGRCIPQTSCTTNSDCSADSMCAGSICQPWDILPEGRRFADTCRTDVDLPSVIPEVQCQWPGTALPTAFPEQVQVISTPMVIDFDSDNDPTSSNPSIVFISYQGIFNQNTGSIRVIDGETCALQDTITGQFPFTPQVPVALGDINGDGRPDIVAADEEPVGAAIRSGIAIFELDGTGPVPKFKSMANGRIRSSGTGKILGFALHDVDGDDRPEIFTEKTMLRYDETQGLINASALQPTGRPELNSMEPPVVIDVDGDRVPEVITPQGVFTWDILNTQFVDKVRGGTQPLWNSSDGDTQGKFIASANLGEFATGLPQGKDSAELVVVGHNGNLWVKTVDGSIRFSMTDAGLRASGPPVIADIDGDGRMEFASGGLGTLTVFDLDCARGDSFNEAGCSGEENADGMVWSVQTQGAFSGLAVFDFNGDRKAELVYADQCYMRVFDGISGDVLFSTPRMSTTQWEYPVVADTDGDRNSEIVTVSNDNDGSVTCPPNDPLNPSVAFQRTHGVTVWKEQRDRWAGSRPVWNQHNYFVTNVRDNGTIPSMTEVQSHWEAGGPNTFRQNVQGATGKSLSLVDVTTAGAAKFECDSEGTATVQIDLCNRGASPVRSDATEIALVNAAERTRVLCRQRNEQAIQPGACIEVSCDISAPDRANPIDLQILGDPLAQVEECNEDNNVSIISRVSCGVISVE